MASAAPAPGTATLRIQLELKADCATAAESTDCPRPHRDDGRDSAGLAQQLRELSPAPEADSASATTLTQTW